MSQSILAWGVNLGNEDSTAATLFDENWDSLPGADEVWDLFTYGPLSPGHQKLALLLVRSMVVKDEEDTDFGCAGFFDLSLGDDGLPHMKSQPTEAELSTLHDLVTELMGKTSAKLSLNLEPLLLPVC